MASLRYPAWPVLAGVNTSSPKWQVVNHIFFCARAMSSKVTIGFSELIFPISIPNKHRIYDPNCHPSALIDLFMRSIKNGSSFRKNHVFSRDQEVSSRHGGYPSKSSSHGFQTVTESRLNPTWRHPFEKPPPWPPWWSPLTSAVFLLGIEWEIHVGNSDGVGNSD